MSWPTEAIVNCTRDIHCARPDGHPDLCVRTDGVAILRRRTPEAAAQIAAAREECGLSAGHAGAHFRGEHLGPEGDACGRPVDGPQCLGTYGSNHGVPLRCSPTAGCGLGDCPWQRPAEPSIVLTGADMAAFDEFALAAAALEVHAEQQQPLQQRYRAALEAMSRMAAKRNRGG